MFRLRTCKTLPPIPNSENLGFRINEILLRKLFVADFLAKPDPITQATRPYQSAGEFHTQIVFVHEFREPVKGQTKTLNFLLSDNVCYVRKATAVFD